jgi:hypothetical protein
VHEERESIRRDRRRLGRRGPLLGSGHDDLDLSSLELRAELLELLVVEVVLERERLQGALFD